MHTFLFAKKWERKSHQKGPLGGYFEHFGGFWEPLGAQEGSREGLGVPFGGPERAPRPKKSRKRRSQERKGIAQEGSWSLLAELKTRFKPKRAPKRGPRAPQEGLQRGLKLKESKR